MFNARNGLDKAISDSGSNTRGSKGGASSRRKTIGFGSDAAAILRIFRFISV